MKNIILIVIILVSIIIVKEIITIRKIMLEKENEWVHIITKENMDLSKWNYIAIEKNRIMDLLYREIIFDKYK